MILTTTHAAPAAVQATAVAWARRLGIPYHPRQRLGLPELLKQCGQAEALVLATHGTWELGHQSGERLAFHPGSARLRVRALRKGGSDPWLRLVGLQPGETLLDTTLGLGADAIVAAYCVGRGGASGRVEGWESQQGLAFLVEQGLQSYDSPDAALVQAMRSITVWHRNHCEHLALLEAKSFDILYFDPMFAKSGSFSNSIQQVRPFSNTTPLAPESIQAAQRIARRAVVLKAQASFPFAAFGFTEVQQCGYHAYGLLRVREGAA